MALATINGDNRRGKTALFFICCALAGALPHWVVQEKNLFPAIALAFILGGYGLRTVLQDLDIRHKFVQKRLIEADRNDADFPSVDVVVAARDEENVIERLVSRLSKLEYPKGKLSIWIIDDGSKDRTPFLLDQLSEQFLNINIIHRSRLSGGGKSGALNNALRLISGDWIFILDADAQLPTDLLMKLMQFALSGGWSAVQLRKAVVNSDQNTIASLQAMEMAMDAVIQLGRLSVGGVAELRGNGQLINRDILDKCGGFNEETVTDDLDLSFRLLIGREPIGLLWDPPIQEEAVDSFQALLRQRKRWAEGGLQRFFDYWSLLLSRRLDIRKKIDLSCFFLLQYALPVVAFVDCFISILTGTLPLYWPLSLVAFSVSGLAFWKGCKRESEGPELPSPLPLNLIFAILYLSHWFFVIPFVVIKMSFFPKKLVWKKTIHNG